MPLHTFKINLTEEDYRQVKALKMRGMGDDDEDAFRSAVMTWYTRNRTPQILPERLLDLDID